MTVPSLGASLRQHIVHIMGMEGMIFATMDYPEKSHHFISRIADDHIAYFKWLQAGNLLPGCLYPLRRYHRARNMVRIMREMIEDNWR